MIHQPSGCECLWQFALAHAVVRTKIGESPLPDQASQTRGAALNLCVTGQDIFSLDHRLELLCTVPWLFSGIGQEDADSEPPISQHVHSPACDPQVLLEIEVIHSLQFELVLASVFSSHRFVSLKVRPLSSFESSKATNSTQPGKTQPGRTFSTQPHLCRAF